MSFFLRLSAAALALFLPVSLLAQVAPGQYQFGAYDSLGPDVINVGNLNVMLDIPVLHKAGRAGTNFTYDLTYNGAFWAPVSNAWVPNVGWGWAGATQTLTGYLQLTTHTENCGTAHLPKISVLNTAPIYFDPLGVAHRWIGSQNIGQCATDHDTITGTWTTDGKYYWVSNSQIKDSLGRIHTVTVNSSTSAGSYTDNNGNKIAYDGNGNFTDTTGAIALNLAGQAPSDQVFTYTDSSGTSRTVTVSYTNYSVATNFGCSGIMEYSETSVPLVDTITLPDNSTYQFTYEPTPGVSGSVTGRIATMKVPAGGVITYAYTGANNGVNCADGSPLGLTRTLTTTSTPPGTYIRTVATGASQTAVLDSMGNQSVYTFVTATDASSGAEEMYPTSVSVTNGTSGTPLIARAICYNGASSPCATQSISLPINSVAAYNTFDAITQNEVANSYDSYGNLGSSITYDFGTASTPGTFLLEDLRAFTGGLLTEEKVLKDNISSDYVTDVKYTYDSQPLQATSGLAQHTSGINSGNLTSVSAATVPGNPSEPWVTTSYTYYDTGSVYQQIAPDGGVTTYNYDSTNTHPTTIAPPDPNGVNMSYSLSYDAYLGQAATIMNPNGVVANLEISDGYGHPAQVTASLSGTTYGKTTTQTLPNQTTVLSYRDGSTATESDSFMDSYGRVIRQTQQSDAGTWYIIDTCYDTNGRVHFSSYPYKATSTTGSKVCSGSGDTYTYDALGRVLTITHGDSPQTSRSYVYKGASTQVTDENGIVHVYQVDGAGRTIIACEVSSTTYNGVAPSSCGTSIAATGFATTYQQSAIGSVIVRQAGQIRLMDVDALGRTSYIGEPEGNFTVYSYSTNSIGNVVTRQKPLANQPDGAGDPGTFAYTTTQYDKLGRIVSISYSDGTPTKTYTYDAAPSGSSFSVGYAKGLMTEAASSNGANTMYAYDPLGRVQTMSQCIPGWCTTGTPAAITRSYQYDWQGNRSSTTFSTGSGSASLGYVFNKAGQLTSLTGGQDSSVPTLYSANTETPYGATAYSLGNGLTASATFDPLGRPNGLGLVQGSTPVYAYTASWTGNQVTGSSDTVNGVSTYGYDDLNRLSSASIQPVSGGPANVTWGYDRFGNRLSQSVSGSYPDSVTNTAFSVDPTTNRLTTSGYTYDGAGNLQTDASGNTYTYDAEGNLISISGGTTASFTYDALNQRVLSTLNGTTLAYGFDASGKRATVWDTNGNLISAQYGKYAYWLAADNHVRFQHRDWVGTTRFRTTYNGGTEGSFRSLLFGDSETTASGSNTDAAHFSFLDSDSQDLKHASFRTYSSIQGRWLSPDLYQGSYDFTDPQSFNRFNYVRNRPSVGTDRMGLSDTDDDNPCGDDDCDDGGDDGGDGGGGYGDGMPDPGPPDLGPPPSPNVVLATSDSITVTADPIGFFFIPDFVFTPQTGYIGGIGPNNVIGAKPNGCMVVNGRTVCPSPIDKYNFLHPGQANYRDSNSRCSQHTTVNNKTGQVQSHIDEFNPNDYFLNHVILDVIPDVIYDITGSYLFPTGNQFCPQ